MKRTLLIASLLFAGCDRDCSRATEGVHRVADGGDTLALCFVAVLACAFVRRLVKGRDR